MAEDTAIAWHALTWPIYIYSTVMVHGSSEEKLVGGLEPPIVGMMIKTPILGKISSQQLSKHEFYIFPKQIGDDDPI
jgi:hypothetical protein